MQWARERHLAYEAPDPAASSILVAPRDRGHGFGCDGAALEGVQAHRHRPVVRWETIGSRFGLARGV